MNDRSQHQNEPDSGQAYTGKTIVMPRQQNNEPAPSRPDKKRTYRNPPPSQRGRKPRSSAAEQPAATSGEARKPRHKNKQVLSTAASPASPAQPGAAVQAPAPPVAPRHTGWRRVRRWLLITLGVVLGLLLLLGGVVYLQARDVASAVVVPDVRANPPLGTPLFGGTTVLLVGVDERPDHPEEGVRSDTLILARFDTPGRWVSLLSIPRDTQVTIPDVGETKINVAYGQGYARAEELFGPGTTPQQGGMALASQTVERFLDLSGRGMRIDYVAQINFDGFVGIIDSLGGITVDVPAYLIDYEYPTEDFGTRVVEFQQGPQRMDGQTALTYARTRHADSDFSRSTRQQQVMQAIAAELRSRGWMGRLAAMPGLMGSLKGAEGATPPVLTTMPFDRPDILLSLAIVGSGLDPESIGRVQITPDEVIVTEIGTNLLWDEAGVKAQVDRWLQAPAPPTATPEAVTQP